MITLTDAPEINSVLGGDVPVSFDKLIVTNIQIDSVNNDIRASLLLTSTTTAEMQPIQGTLLIVFAPGTLKIEVPQLDFYRRIVLSAPQKTAIAAIATDAQDTLESGLSSLGLIAGVQTSGT